MAKGIQWRKLVNVQDVGDIVAVVMSVRKLLATRGEQAAHRVEKGVKDSHVLEEIAMLADRSGKLLARKKREFEKASQHTAERVKHDIQESPVTHRVEEAASNLRERVDQKTYETAKQIVESHEQRHPEDTGEAGVFVLGAIIGAVAGVALAMWYAPQSGEETRHELERTAEEARRRVEGDSLNDAIKEGKAEARRYQELAGGR